MISAQADIDLLLSRLNVNAEPALDRRILSNKIRAKTLLKYYKERTNVNHLVHRTASIAEGAVSINPTDKKRADDALQNIMLGQPAYPASDRGSNIDWKTSPVADKEWIWQLHRMYFWNAMGRMYAATRDEEYVKVWARQLIDWTRKNPNDSLHQYAWRSIETGIRGYSWTGLFQYFIDSKHFDEKVLVAFLNSCYEHALHLMNHYRSGSNWALMEAEGLAFIAITFPEFKDSDQWLATSIDRLNRELNIQVYPDGHQRELAMGYHIGCIRWFLRTYQLAKLNGLENAFDPAYLDVLEKMCAVPMKICLPDGTNVQFGDAWAGEPGQHKDNFLQWAELFDRDDFLYLASDGSRGNAPDSTAFALRSSGIYSMRSGWDAEAICLVLKCGPDGGGHCQPDNGTFDLYAGGRNLMPDAGSYIYSGNPEQRAWFRQTSVHQTLTLNNKNSQYAPQLRLWQPSDSMDVLVVENQSYDDLRHRRSVLFIDKKYFVIIDEASGQSTGDIRVHFQLTPGPALLDSTELTARTRFNEGWNLSVEAQPEEGISMVEELGQVSFLYTKKEPRPAFCFHQNKASSKEAVRFVTVLIPYQQDGTPPTIHAEVISDALSPETSVVITSEESSRVFEFQVGAIEKQ